jgi:polar amino acid transport system substrate-binding protein
LTPSRLLSALVLVVLAACGGAPEATDLWENSVIRRARERGKLVVALEAEFRPFEYVEADGSLAGFDVDLAREIARHLGTEIEFRNVPWESIVAELTTGQADLIVSGMTATPQRALTLSYSQPYFHTRTCLLVSKERAPDVRSVTDLDRAGRIVAVKQGTTGEEAARVRCPKAEILTFKTENGAALEVAQGRADAFLYDLASVRAHHEQNPDTTFLLLDAVSVEPYAIACRKGDPETIAWLDLVLAHMRKDGRLEALYERHGLVEENPASDAR